MVYTMVPDRTKLALFILAIVPLVIGSFIAAMILSSGIIGTIIGGSRTFTVFELLGQAVLSIIIGTLVVVSLFWVMRNRGHGAQRMIVAFVVSPILGFISIFIGETFLLVMFKGTSNIFAGLLLVVSLGISMLAIALVVIDVIPPVVRNIFVAFYGSIFGTFIGVTLVTSSIFVIIITVILEDYFLTRYHPVADVEVMQYRAGSDPFDYTQIQTKWATIGVGDYIIYSLIAAHSLIMFPMFVWAMSALLLTFGIAINVFILVRKDELFPAIPLPAMMAIFPWFAYLFAMVSFA